MDGRRATLVFLPVFFASGFAALAYQIVWQRLLAFLSGADVFSVTLIVSAFMAGLGLGSLAGGHLADRLSFRGRFRAFALAEAAIAAFALVSVPLLYDVLYRRLAPRASPWSFVGLLLFAVLLWPTFLMGLSLPLLARALTETPAASARRIGSLYGWNTLGAALGALVTVFVVVRLHGFAAAVGRRGGLNLACAATALLALRWLRLDGGPPAPADAPPPAAGAPTEGRLAFALLAPPLLPLRFVALSLEILWFRVLGVIVKSNSFTFAWLLTLYLSGVGLGALLGRSAAARSASPAGTDSSFCRCWWRATPACPWRRSSTGSRRGRRSPGCAPTSASTKRSSWTRRCARLLRYCPARGRRAVRAGPRRPARPSLRGACRGPHRRPHAPDGGELPVPAARGARGPRPPRAARGLAAGGRTSRARPSARA